MGPSEQRFPVALSHQKPSNHLDWLSCVCSYLEHSPSIEQSTDKIMFYHPNNVCLFVCLVCFRSSEQRFPVALTSKAEQLDWFAPKSICICKGEVSLVEQEQLNIVLSPPIYNSLSHFAIVI